MTRHTPFTAPRAIYDDDLQVRIDAAIARTRRFIKVSEAIRATAKRPFVPFCLSCQQAGHRHDSPPTGEQHYICAHCHRRWVAQPVCLVAMSAEDLPPDRSQPLTPLPWWRIELALFALFVAFIVAGVFLALW